MKKVYCAGPLFNQKEREEMAEMADALESNGLSVFLPHRDGFEFADLHNVFLEIGCTEEQTNIILNKAIFTLDVFQVLSSDGLVLNINGRVPDEGAVVEAGIAWNAGKKVVLYKNDSRTLLKGSDNPLLSGLGDFKLVSNISDVPKIFLDYFRKRQPFQNQSIDNSCVKKLFQKGEKISEIAIQTENKVRVCQRLIEVLDI
jgi:nucleoside 2-deoxyribosyltransferase